MGDKSPAFLRRQQPIAPTQPPISQRLEDHPRVREFFNEYVTERERQRELAEQLAAAEREIDKLQGRCSYLQDELGRALYSRDEYAAGYNELKAQLRVISATSVGSLKSVIDVIEAAWREATARMEAVPRPAPATDAPPADVLDSLEEGIKKIGEKFGANTRKPEPGEENAG